MKSENNGGERYIMIIAKMLSNYNFLYFFFILCSSCCFLIRHTRCILINYQLDDIFCCSKWHLILVEACRWSFKFLTLITISIHQQTSDRRTRQKSPSSWLTRISIFYNQFLQLQMIWTFFDTLVRIKA